MEGKAVTTKGRRLTKQREAIVEVLRQSTAHPDAITIYDEVRKHIPNISLGTVYRILSELHSHGEILEFAHGTALRRFDGRTDDHHHITCLLCGRMDDVEILFQTDLDRLASESGYEVTEHRLEFFGYCPACRKRE